jgi:hypothetical protein
VAFYAAHAMKKLIYIAISLIVNQLNAQDLYDQIWVFDKYIIFDFSTEPPTITLENPSPWLGPGDFTTSICNKYGELQFYSGGCFVGNRLHEVMENGDNINAAFSYTGWCNYGDIPISHNNTIIPFPNDTTRYYLFNLDMSANNLNPQHLYYHVIDMAQGEGLGSVIEKKKIAIAHDFLASGSVTATRHANGYDWWVVVPKSISNCYFLVPATANGVGAPQEQCLGLFFNEHDSGGQAVFSPDGAKYARVEADNGLVLMNFDATTGQFSNPLELVYDDEYNFADGACFSGNSRYLYITATTKVYQFDTEAADIQASRQLVGEIDPDTLAPGMGALASSKLAPNGKIYVVTPGLHRYTSTIERPNCPGTLCNFQAHKIMLPANNYAGINNLPHFRVPEQTYDCEPVGIVDVAEVGGVKLSPNPASDFILLTTSEGGLIDIFTPEGRLLESLTFGTGETTRPLDLRPGLYFFCFRFESGGIEVKKVVVQH